MSRTRTGVLVVAATIAVVGFSLAFAGDLDPPAGPITATMKTLDDVRPSTPIQSLPATATAVHVISMPGSYHLTGDLSVPSGLSGIEILADWVTIDLSGFTIVAENSAVHGVSVPNEQKSLTIENGRISGFSERGIDAPMADRTNFRALEVSGNALEGIVTRNTSTLTDCLIQNNGVGNDAHGFQSEFGCVVENCTFEGNGRSGLRVFQELVVRGSRFDANGFIGVDACCNVLVVDSEANNHGAAGFAVDGSARFERCISNSNGNGFWIRNNGTIIDCHASSNAIYGILVPCCGEGVRVEGNNVTNNGTGIRIEQPGHIVLKNTAQGNETSYDIAGGNAFGPIINVSGADLSTVAGADHPWANFEY